ncbi:hypothetical protein HK102_010404 [Quaeritorhiza haematococci]|nr:hypothetical protein HK102_010404 [Quaeritorhiza haematococci]
MSSISEQLELEIRLRQQIDQRIEQLRASQAAENQATVRQRVSQRSLQAAHTQLLRAEQQVSRVHDIIDAHLRDIQQRQAAFQRIREEVLTENTDGRATRNQQEIEQEVKDREARINNEIQDLERQVDANSAIIRPLLNQAAEYQRVVDTLERQPLPAITPIQPAAPPPQPTKPRAPPSGLPTFNPASTKTEERDPATFLSIYQLKASSAAPTSEELLRWLSSSLSPLVMRTYGSVKSRFTNFEEAGAWLTSRYNSNNELRDVHNELLHIKLRKDETGIMFGDRFIELLDLCHINHAGPLDENTTTIFINAMPPEIAFELSKLKNTLRTVEDYVNAVSNLMQALKRAGKLVFPPGWLSRPSSASSNLAPRTNSTPAPTPTSTSAYRPSAAGVNDNTRYQPYGRPAWCPIHNAAHARFDEQCRQLLQQRPNHCRLHPNATHTNEECIQQQRQQQPRPQNPSGANVSGNPQSNSRNNSNRSNSIYGGGNGNKFGAQSQSSTSIRQMTLSLDDEEMRKVLHDVIVDENAEPTPDYEPQVELTNNDGEGGGNEDQQ